jgi:hypothetical protein
VHFSGKAVEIASETLWKTGGFAAQKLLKFHEA